MSLMLWKPFQEIERLQHDVNRLFEGLSTNDGENDRSAFIPLAELEETPDVIHLSLEMPGMDIKDIDVQVSAEAIAISGDRKKETKTEEKGMTRTEFHYGRFRRVIPLPVRIENTNVKADYKNGILTLVAPKAEEEKHKIVKLNLLSSTENS
jgi:HSP20 family protein